MNDEKMKELMIDYVEGRLEGELKDFVEKQIDKRSELREEIEELRQGVDLLQSDIELDPDSTFKLNFEKMLEEEIESFSSEVNEESKGAKVIKMNYLPRIAAAIALLVSGAFVGWWVNNQNDNSDELTAMHDEIKETRRLVMESLNDEQSASTRLNGVNVAYSTITPDNEIIQVLIKTLSNDDNTNVRLAAARALQKFSDIPLARKALLDGITTQDDAVVQIELINIIVEMKETGALEQLEEVIKNDEALQTVKDEAHMAVFKLS
ncbi:MAG: HEAT repeat domain-containing protein [Bacteroidota bacterium]